MQPLVKKLLTRAQKVKGLALALENSLEGEPDCMKVCFRLRLYKVQLMG